MPRSEVPLEGDDALTAFAVDLRTLRQKAGSPPYRQLAREAHYSSSTLADAAGGRRLPSMAVALAYVRACGGDPGPWEARWRQVAAALAVEAPADAETDLPDGLECPYAGLSAFGPGDAARFFGRERLTEELVARVRSRRLTALFGASGSGKSSLLCAGLLPQLGGRTGTAEKNAACKGMVRGQGWPVLLFTPGPHPLDECAARLAALTGSSAAVLHRQLREDPRALHLAALQMLVEHPVDADLLVVVDQFEEVFTLCAEDEREQFLNALLTAAGEANSRVRVLLGVRADFYPRCVQHPELVEALRDAQVLVGPMSTEELRRAISAPAAAAGCAVEGALLARVVADAAGQPNALPLVSHALRETWRHRRGNALTVSGYEAVGGIHYALAHTAQSTYQALSEEQQRLACGILLRLVALGQGTEDTKRPAARGEFDTPDADAVLDALARARLITLDVGTVQLTHEALLHAWPQLRRWIDEDRAGLLIRQQLIDASAAWERERRDTDALYRGERLAVATAWAEGHHDLPLDERSRRFLAASTRHARHATRARRGAIAALCVLSLLAATAAVIAQRNVGQARSQHLVALSRQLAADSAAAAMQQPVLARQLAWTAWAVAPTAEARAAMIALLTTDHQHGTIVTAAKANTTAFSPIAKIISTGSGHGTVLHRDPATARPLATIHDVTPRTDLSGVRSVAFSPDGKTLAAGADDGTVRLWDPATGRPLATIHDKAPNPDTDGVSSVAFSPDGKILVAGADDGTVRLWDPATGHPLATIHDVTPSAPVGGVFSVVFSPDGKTLAAGGVDGTVRLWDPATARPLATIHDEDPRNPADGEVLSVAFSPDGTILAAAGSDGTVQLWSPATGRPLRTPIYETTNPEDEVESIAFSPDGKDLAVGEDDGTVRLWDPATAHPLATIHDDETRTPDRDMVSSVAFSPDGKILAAGTGDGIVRLWDPATARPPSAPIRDVIPSSDPGRVFSVAFSPDGKVLAAGVDGDTVRLWDPATGRSLATIHAAEVTSVAFSSDGKALATGTSEGMVWLWDPASGRLLTGIHSEVLAQGVPVISVAFSPDGSTLAAAGADGTVQLWSSTTGHLRATILDEDPAGRGIAIVRSLAFDPAGKTLAVVEDNGTVRLWDPATRRPLATIHDDAPNPSTDGVSSVAFSPDGKILATAGVDGTVRLWSSATGQPEDTLVNERGANPVAPISSVAFSPDGRTLAAGADDGTVQVWPLFQAADAYAILCSDVGPPAADVWKRLAPGEAQPATCRSTE